MLGWLPEPQHMPCPECGASVERVEREHHTCERERWLAYQLFHRREEIERFDQELGAFLSSPRGRFESWYADRERRRAA